MAGAYFPSGDPVAERNAAFAETMAYMGDLTAAIEALRDALSITPNWAAGWCKLGDYLDQSGDPTAALDAWERALAADPQDPFGARIKCALARQDADSDTMPAAFVEMLFDQYAGHFDTSLVGRLRYGAPREIKAALNRNRIGRAARALDLGCGTGLSGAVLRQRCDWLEGVDLSAGMLEVARRKGIYDQLTKGNITELPPPTEPYDLITACDVFNYLGKLDPMLLWCAQALTAQGTLAFTVERGVAACTLHKGKRFAHGPDYVAQALRQAGLVWADLREVTLRQEHGEPVAGLAVTARFDAPAKPERAT